MSDLINTLINLSEKAANIARLIRQDKHLLSLLVQEKKGDEKNQRFIQDFKTFADVLVQEVVKHELEQKYPSLKGHVHGEENNEFIIEGEKITVEIKDDESETKALLLKVLQDIQAAEPLAQEVHRKIMSMENIELPSELPQTLAVWIDPIDSTAEYIDGCDGDGSDLVSSGVQCVTILIGVFNYDTGAPIIGVINQPFCINRNNRWMGRCVYGTRINSCVTLSPLLDLNGSEGSDGDKVLVVSSSECEDVKRRLAVGYRLVEAAGCGYKLLAVAVGQACGYVLSKASTYPWDVCAGHAILNALGGGVVDFTTRSPLLYSASHSSNSGGIVAYRHPAELSRITSLLDD